MVVIVTSSREQPAAFVLRAKEPWCSKQEEDLFFFLGVLLGGLHKAIHWHLFERELWPSTKFEPPSQTKPAMNASPCAQDKARDLSVSILAPTRMISKGIGMDL